MVWPTLILSHSLTRISFTVPLTDEGTSTTALSVSSSMTACPPLSPAPGATFSRTKSPCSIFSPSAGSLNSISDAILDSIFLYREKTFLCSIPANCAIGGSAGSWVRLARIDAQISNRLLHGIQRNFLFARQSSECGKHNVLGIHFKEVAQGGTIFAAAKPIGPQRHQLSRNPLGQ